MSKSIDDFIRSGGCDRFEPPDSASDRILDRLDSDASACAADAGMDEAEEDLEHFNAWLAEIDRKRAKSSAKLDEIEASILDRWDAENEPERFDGDPL